MAFSPSLWITGLYSNLRLRINVGIEDWELEIRYWKLEISYRYSNYVITNPQLLIPNYRLKR